MLSESFDRRRSVGEVTSLANHDGLISFFLLQNKQRWLQSHAWEGQLHTAVSMTASQSEDGFSLYTTNWWLLL